MNSVDIPSTPKRKKWPLIAGGVAVVVLIVAVSDSSNVEEVVAPTTTVAPIVTDAPTTTAAVTTTTASPLMSDDELNAFIIPIAAQDTWDKLGVSEQSDMCDARALYGDDFVDLAIRSGMPDASENDQSAMVAAFFDILDTQC